MAACPSTGAWADVADNVNIDGTLWHACDVGSPTKRRRHIPHRLPRLRGDGVQLGATEADRPSTPTASGTLDRKAIFRWLLHNDVPGDSYPHLQPASSVEAISQGLELPRPEA